MKNRNTESYRTTHKKLAKALQEACLDDRFDDYREPEIDLSFLDEDPVEEKKKEKRNLYWKPSLSFGKVAFAVIVLLLTANLVTMWTQSSVSYGEKGLLHRLFQTENGIVTDNDNPVGEDEVIKQYIISSEEEKQVVLEKFPEMYYLGYVPSDYMFENMKVDLYASDDCIVEYVYVNDEQRMTVNCVYSDDPAKGNYLIKKDEVDVLKYRDRNIYIYHDNKKNAYVADVTFETCIVSIVGINDKEQLIIVARNLKNI